MSDKVTHIGQLKFDKRNPRKHNPRNIGVIVDSLQQVGPARSIVIDENDNVLAGNGVTEAAAIAGIEKVVEVEADGDAIIAVRRRGLTEEQKQKLKYYDNRASDLAGWDIETILADIEAGVNLDGLFNQDELGALLEKAGMEFLKGAGDDPYKEWQGMPEFENEDAFGAVATIKVHFVNEHDVATFAKHIGQNVSIDTRFIWYPKQEPENLLKYRVVDES